MIQCPHFRDMYGTQTCEVVRELSGLPVGECRVGEDACRACIALPDARTRNHVTISMTLANIRRVEPERYVDASRELLAPPDGVGTELKSMLARIGITSEPGCKCNLHAAEMNRRGIAWCRANVDTIVGWLKEEAKRRRMPFSGFAAMPLVHLAIMRAERRRERMGSQWRGVP